MSTNTSTSVRTSTESRALELLGSGLPLETVASACGVSVSRISQLMSEQEFSQEVATLRFNALQKHNKIDNKYDALEEKLLGQLERGISMLFKPNEVLNAIRIVNAAKRRGSSAPEAVVQQQTVVNLVLPAQVVQKFTVNINNQVINAGEQTLQTIQSNTLMEQIKQKEGTLDALLLPSDSSTKDIIL